MKDAWFVKQCCHTQLTPKGLPQFGWRTQNCVTHPLVLWLVSSAGAHWGKLCSFPCQHSCATTWAAVSPAVKQARGHVVLVCPAVGIVHHALPAGGATPSYSVEHQKHQGQVNIQLRLLGQIQPKLLNAALWMQGCKAMHARAAVGWHSACSFARQLLHQHPCNPTYLVRTDSVDLS